ncbi:hypothetical protein SMF913_13032 [Streptomyces malaysiensis]|uniref:Uncharacterized protein n=1 Tax=Streptomyces malaysiensis TaxID=92644 RepID=A0A2J7Z9P4_STRMQ|nr:hypothetical protein SMF913_13032 [Streptomyces malaysiensis]
MEYLFLGHSWRSAQTGAAGAGDVQTLVGVLDDEFMDELRQRGKHVEREPTAGRGEVERFP